ncbi:uncharacterized protein ALTATR162_LOCUS8901 [Alternaria atra]|uniref:Uncharacterized protein n=1 Tax=Alternaria atra TaxID=119953 RepID=A0A8J2I7Q8_9PLEO|nr:uncharacterized protein ALTATR162_LOCUS8901 [Alternaria atra]CAG5178839.1 unnamed protein product [Alternaria atra]
MDNLTQCYECMRQAGVDLDNVYQLSFQMRLMIHNFCNTGSPNVYELLRFFLTWLKSTNEPADHNTKLGGILSISTLASYFTSTSGMNEPTVIFSSPQTTETPSSENTLTVSDGMPPEYLQQLPENWPYTAYGVARKANQTTSFPLTDPTSTSVTAAWLFHKMLWNPRPLTPGLGTNILGRECSEHNNQCFVKSQYRDTRSHSHAGHAGIGRTGIVCFFHNDDYDYVICIFNNDNYNIYDYSESQVTHIYVHIHTQYAFDRIITTLCSPFFLLVLLAEAGPRSSSVSSRVGSE